MKFTARRTAAMICAGAIAMSVVALPVASAEVHTTNASAGTTQISSPPVFSHATVA